MKSLLVSVFLIRSYENSFPVQLSCEEECLNSEYQLTNRNLKIKKKILIPHARRLPLTEQPVARLQIRSLSSCGEAAELPHSRTGGVGRTSQNILKGDNSSMTAGVLYCSTLLNFAFNQLCLNIDDFQVSLLAFVVRIRGSASQFQTKPALDRTQLKPRLTVDYLVGAVRKQSPITYLVRTAVGNILQELSPRIRENIFF